MFSNESFFEQMEIALTIVISLLFILNVARKGERAKKVKQAEQQEQLNKTE
jgi:hypothetical protein